MGWTSSSDMKSQIKLSSSFKEEAIAYCERNGIAYRVEEPKPRERLAAIVSYATFKTNRLGLWTALTRRTKNTRSSTG